MRNRVGLFIVSIAVTAILLLHVSGKYQFRFLNELEYKAYDIRLRLMMPGKVDPRVVIIDIDEQSLANQGRWPWPRDKLANLVDILFDHYGVEVLGFDVVFAEPDEDRILQPYRQKLLNGETVSDEIQQLLARPGRDEIFASALSRHNVVLGYTMDRVAKFESTGQLPTPLFEDVDLISETDAPLAARFTSNLPILQSVAHGGFFSLIGNVDSDGTYRRISLLNKFDGKLYEAFSLSVARHYLGTEVEPVVADREDLDYAGLEFLDLGFNVISVDANASVYVPFRGNQGSFRYISADEVLKKSVTQPEDLEGIIALVGTSADGLVDLRPTPVQSVYPGVEIHANLVAGLMDGAFKIQPEWVRGGETLVVVAVGLLLTFLLPWLSAFWMTLVTASFSILIVAANLYLWREHNFVLPLASSILLVFAIYLVNMIYGFFTETKARRFLKQSFGLYVPPEIVHEMQYSKDNISLGSEKREMTVLFTDIRGFTTIAESLDPQELSALMNAFLTPMTATVHRHRGAVDKYMGDAMMAFWGAPLVDIDHAQHAVEAAMEMTRKISQINTGFVARGWPKIKMGIGLNSGSMSVGNMGSEFRMAYTILGDAVNLGSRLEGLTKVYEVDIIVSESTANSVPGYAFRELDKVRVKGKSEPITIFEPLAKIENLTLQQKNMIEIMEQALHHYRHQDWDQSEALFNQLIADNNDRVYQIHLDLITQHRKNPPPVNWDGVFNYEDK